VRAHLLFGPQGRQLLTSRNIDFRLYACPSLSANRLEYNEPLISDHSSRTTHLGPLIQSLRYGGTRIARISRSKDLSAVSPTVLNIRKLESSILHIVPVYLGHSLVCRVSRSKNSSPLCQNYILVSMVTK
jgi:hypothetical protein